MISDTDEPDFLDMVIPNLTIAERGEILKILIIPLIFIIKNYFMYFFNTPEKITLQSLATLPVQIVQTKGIILEQICKGTKITDKDSIKKSLESLQKFKEIDGKLTEINSKLYTNSKQFMKVYFEKYQNVQNKEMNLIEMGNNVSQAQKDTLEKT